MDAGFDADRGQAILPPCVVRAAPYPLPRPMSEPSPAQVPGTLRMFGSEDTPARLRVLPRTTGWRAIRAGSFIVAGVVAAPIAVLLPPHVVWASAAVGTGVFLGLRKWAERYTVLEMEGRCPNCGETLGVTSATRLRNPWTVSCDHCHRAAVLEVRPEDLPAAG